MDLDWLFGWEDILDKEGNPTGETEAKLTPVGLGLTSLLGFGGTAMGAFDPNIPRSGYQGSVPKYQAVRERVANTYDPNRRPGSGGRRYFTDTTFVDTEKEGAEQALAEAIAAAKTQAGALEATNLANPANEIRNIADTPVTETPVNEESLTLPTVPTAQSMMPTTASPFTDPYQHIADDPTNPMNLNTGGEVSTIEKALMNYDPGTVGGLLGLLGIKKPGPEIKERPSFTEIDLGMRDPDKRIRTAFQKGRFGELPMTPKEEAEFLRMFGTDYIDRAGPKGSRRRGFNLGGIAQLQSRYLNGTTDGMADSVPAMIDNQDPAALSDGEYVVAADVVSGIGNGNSNAGARKLDQMMSNIRQARTGTTKQAPAIDFNNILSA